MTEDNIGTDVWQNSNDISDNRSVKLASSSQILQIIQQEEEVLPDYNLENNFTLE